MLRVDARSPTSVSPLSPASVDGPSASVLASASSASRRVPCSSVSVSRGLSSSPGMPEMIAGAGPVRTDRENRHFHSRFRFRFTTHYSAAKQPHVLARLLCPRGSRRSPCRRDERDGSSVHLLEQTLAQ